MSYNVFDGMLQPYLTFMIQCTDLVNCLFLMLLPLENLGRGIMVPASVNTGLCCVTLYVYLIEGFQ